jgi:ribonuclease P protein component
MDQGAGRKYRLKRREDIARLFEGGRRVSDAVITLYAIENPTCEHARMGVGVSAKHGGAVVRNRIKRLCREAFRLTRGELPGGWDYVIVPRVGGRFTLERLRGSIKALGARVTTEESRQDGKQ